MSTAPSIQKQIEGELARLVREGDEILKRAGWDGREYQETFPGDVEYLKFRTSALNLVRRACGETSDHYSQLRQIAEDKESKGNPYYMHHCVGVVHAALEDFSRGLLFDLRAAVAAELLGDFLDQSEHLLGDGYHIAAASLAGAVLEDGLRRLCQFRFSRRPRSRDSTFLSPKLVFTTSWFRSRLRL